MTTDSAAAAAGALRRRVGVVGHRGAPRECPENTLPSFVRALALGVDGIELDVHATRDGVVVVHHDPVPRGPAPTPALANRRIDHLSYGDLQGFAIRGRSRIPTLAEVLATVNGRVEVFVEIKGSAIEQAVVDVIRASSAPERCAVHSFDHAAVRRARELAPELRGGILFDRTLPLSEVRSAMDSAHAVDAWPQWELVDAALADAVHDAGGRVIAWTVNRPEQVAPLVASGVDLLCTDVVADIRNALSPTT